MKKTDLIKIGKEMERQREAAGIPKTLMAYLLDVDPKTIDNYEKGKVKPSRAARFCYAHADQLRADHLVAPVSSCKQLTLFADLMLSDLCDETVAPTMGEEFRALAPVAA